LLYLQAWCFLRGDRVYKTHAVVGKGFMVGGGWLNDRVLRFGVSPVCASRSPGVRAPLTTGQDALQLRVTAAEGSIAGLTRDKVVLRAALQLSPLPVLRPMPLTLGRCWCSQ
jgi:hypothetical protein